MTAAELDGSVLQILSGLSVTVSCVWTFHRSTRKTWCVRCCRTLSTCSVPSAEHPAILADLCPHWPAPLLHHPLPQLDLLVCDCYWPMLRLPLASAAHQPGHWQPHAAVDPRMYQLHVSMKGFRLLLSHARLHCTISAFTQSPGLTLVLPLVLTYLLDLLNILYLQCWFKIYARHLKLAGNHLTSAKMSNFPTQPVLSPHATERRCQDFWHIRDVEK